MLKIRVGSFNTTIIFLVVLLVACIQNSEEMHQKSCPLLFPFWLNVRKWHITAICVALHHC